MPAPGVMLLQSIHDDFERTPDLRVNLADAQIRWWGDVSLLQAALHFLVAIRYLTRSPNGVYLRMEHGAAAPDAARS